MARKARVEFEGAVYHVLDRGVRQEAIFRDEEDRRAFLLTLGQAAQRRRGAGAGWLSDTLPRPTESRTTGRD